jgi:hypothetical protein
VGGRGGAPCYAFQRGECDRGSGCRFSHDTRGGDGGRTDRDNWRERGGDNEGRPSRGKSSQVCYKFQKGECTFGDSCRFSHEVEN